MRERLQAALAAVERRLPSRVGGLLRRFADAEILLSASSLAFYGLVSALPLLLITFAAVDAVTSDDSLARFAQQLSQRGIEGVSEFVDQMAEGGGSLTVTTLLFTIWPATAYGGGLRRELSRHSDRSQSGAGLRGRLLGLSLVLVLPVLVLAGIPMMFFLTTLSGDGVVATLVGWTVAFGAGTLLATAVVTGLYLAFVPGGLGWRETLGGAALTAALTALFSISFVLYLQLGDTEDRFGGGAVAIVVLLGIWLFVANILLLGGFETILELGGVLEDSDEDRTDEDGTDGGETDEDGTDGGETDGGETDEDGTDGGETDGGDGR